MTDAREITLALGGRWCGSYGLCRCPCHDDRSPSLKIKDDARKSDGVDLVCFANCDWRDIKSALTRQRLLPAFSAGQAPRAPWQFTPKDVNAKNDADDTARKIEFAAKIWRASGPLAGTLGERYLIETRRLDGVQHLDLGHALRFHAGAEAVVALMSDPRTGQPCGVHRTFLDGDGQKRDRRMLGRAGVVMLSANEDVTTGLGVCEGVEDGLAILLTGWAPIWTVTSAGVLGRFPVLAGIEHLTIFADADDAGRKAAEECSARWIADGQEARIVLP